MLTGTRVRTRHQKIKTQQNIFMNVRFSELSLPLILYCFSCLMKISIEKVYLLLDNIKYNVHMKHISYPSYMPEIHATCMCVYSIVIQLYILSSILCAFCSWMGLTVSCWWVELWKIQYQIKLRKQKQ